MEITAEHIVTLIVACLSSSGLTGIITTCLQRHWAQQDKKNAKETEEQKMLKLLLEHEKIMTVDRITWTGKSYIKHGEISLQDKNNFLDMYNSAKNLGMNGHCKNILDEINKLPVI